MHLGFSLIFEKIQVIVLEYDAFMHVCLFACMHTRSPHKPVQTCRGQLIRESWTFSNQQIRLDLFWKGKHSLFCVVYVLIKLKILSGCLNSVSKDSLCFTLAHYAYHRIMFSSKLLLERRTDAKYIYIYI